MEFSRRDLASALAGVAATGFGPAAVAGDIALKAELERRAPGWLAEAGAPSVAAALVRDGRLAWTMACGERAPGEPARSDTLYNVASLTKPVTAEVLLQLAAAGRLSLDEPMVRWWADPGLAPGPWRERLTARIALRHETGFANWRRETGGELRFRFEPGTKAEYSGEGYVYAARFAERRTGAPFEALAERYVFAPNGMRDTSYAIRRGTAGRLAWAKTAKGFQPPAYDQGWNAADFLRTSVGDYARLLIGVMADRGLPKALAADRLAIHREQREVLCDVHAVGPELCPTHLGFGLGWGVFRYGDEILAEHGGGDDGVRTLALFDPRRRLGVVVFTNGENGMRVIRSVVGLLYDNPAFLAFLDLQVRAG